MAARKTKMFRKEAYSQLLSLKLIQKSIPKGRIKTQSLNILVTLATPQI